MKIEINAGGRYVAIDVDGACDIADAIDRAESLWRRLDSPRHPLEATGMGFQAERSYGPDYVSAHPVHMGER